MKKRALFLFAALFSLSLIQGCKKDNPALTPGPDPGPGEITAERNGESGITYQLLVYSFADSDADGIGDFNGITSRLDYLKDLGTTALWLSPIHPASSYHGYDVLDYSAVNPDFGTEADLQTLIDKAHEKGIKIYLDFVLNHTSKDHPWFLDAKTDADSPYRDYFIFSEDPAADIKAGKIPMIASEGGSGYDSGQWYPAVNGKSENEKVRFTLTLDAQRKPYGLTAEKVDAISNSGGQNSGVYLYYGDGRMAEFHTTGGSTLSLSLEFTSDWGLLVRTSTTEWGSHKYGAPKGSNHLAWGETLLLSNSDAQDILMPDMSYTMYHSHMWTSYFADLNYGPAETAEDSPAFKAVCEAADKWIEMGVDGFRLDAIKHIYHNAYSDENPLFLKKFYDRCNATYKAGGGKGDIYMVGEQFSSANEVAPYYKGLPAFFEFSFWWTLKDAIQNAQGSTFVGTIQSYQNMYAQYRSDYIEATKLSNHDENRAGNDLGKNKAKMKLAGCVLLTAGGQPYIYQGEELGYWGVKNNGDEFVRTPIVWNADCSGLADAYLGDKVDRSMISQAISVESQSERESSVLSCYRKFGVARDSYKALSQGSFDYCAASASLENISAWYRSLDDEKLLVVHNFGAAPTSVTFQNDALDKLVVSNGSVSVKGDKLTLGSYSSAVFLQ